MKVNRRSKREVDYSSSDSDSNAIQLLNRRKLVPVSKEKHTVKKQMVEEDDSDDAENETDEDVENEEEENSQDDDDEEDGEDESLSGSEKEDDTQKRPDLKGSIKAELNKMSFEEIRKLQNNLGLKRFKEVMNDDQENESKSKDFKRLNKNRPQEISSKKRVSSFRNVFQVKKKEFIDPRFNSAFGEYKPEFFRKRYSFINEIRVKEKDSLADQLRNENNPDEKEKIKSALSRLKQQIKSFEESEKKEESKLKLKSLATQEAKEGKRPHFINKSEQKILDLAEKYKELKKSGKIEKFLAKKRKKQLGKDSKHLNKNEHVRFV